MKPSQRISLTLKAVTLTAAMLAALPTCVAQSSQPLPNAPSPVLRGPGGVVVERAAPGPLALSLDDAVSRALQQNAQLKIDEQSVRLVQGQIGTAFNALLPSLTAEAQSGAQETDLAALGFKPSSLASYGLNASDFPLIVKVNTTSAQMDISQTVFNAPAYEVYRAAQHEVQAANLNQLMTRGNVVLDSAAQYLRTLADEAQIADNQALLKQDEEELRQARDRDEASVGTHLDVIRAQVQLQTQQQALVSAQNTFDKDKIELNRILGLPAEQQLELTDTVPDSPVPVVSLADAKVTAFQRRKDYLDLLAQLEVARRERTAVRYERLPTVGYKGFYGVLGETGGLYHGVFTAQGMVNVPIFREAQWRSEQEAADASIRRLENQIASTRIDIEEQIRSDQLDVQAAGELVKVARSNVDLAREELSDASDRYAAGVDDNLRVVEAQAEAAQAEATLIEDQFQFNRAKLSLARSTGVVETQYRTYLGR